MSSFRLVSVVRRSTSTPAVQRRVQSSLTTAAAAVASGNNTFHHAQRQQPQWRGNAQLSSQFNGSCSSIGGSSSRRAYSFDSFSGGGGGGGGSAGTSESSMIHQWPIRKTNMILNIVPQGQRFVVERFGKLHEIEPSGFFFAIPYVDHIAYVIDVRERAIDIAPQAAITKDNVSVQVSGNVYVQFVDPEKAAYGARNPLYAVMQHAQSAMRAAIGEMELDEILHGRAKLNTLIKGSVQEAAVAWGMEIRRYEITEITPDEEIRNAMDKQAAAERTRREQVLQAEGMKQRAQLASEGVKIQLSNESEGMLIKVRNEAEAEKIKRMREAEGEAEAIRLKAIAQAEAIAKISAELNKPGGQEAAKLAVAQEYIDMFGEMGKQSNTMMFNDRPADVNALLAQAAMAIQVVPKGLGAGGKEESTEKKESMTDANGGK